MIAASNSWVVAFDNLSLLPWWLSDALCTLATGGSFATRELYSDAEEKIFDAMRPVLLNGIDDVAVRSDLLDRSICLTLESVDDEKRLTESEIWARFEKVRPRLLGALLDLVSAALRNLPAVHPTAKPRMADFAEWAAAAEPGWGWQLGTILGAYARNRGLLNLVALEAAVIASPIQRLMEAQSRWEGTAAELLTALESLVDDATRKRKEWPSSPRRLAGDLRRLAVNLRQEGIDVSFMRSPGGRRRRIVRLERVCISSSPSSPSSPSSRLPGSSNANPVFSETSDNPAKRDGRDDRGDDGPDDRPQHL
jgi:hypothetical protein